MKKIALLLLAFFSNADLQAQAYTKPDSILSNCPCDVKDLRRAQKRAKYLWGGGWILRVKCQNQAYFFKTQKAYATLGRYLAKDPPFKARSKIIFQNPHRIGVRIGGGFAVYYRFNEGKWGMPVRPYLPKESLRTTIP